MKYQTISLKQFHPAKGAIYYAAIATVIFWHVKITCYFHVWRYHVFARKLTWYFIGVYIIIENIARWIIYFLRIICKGNTSVYARHVTGKLKETGKFIKGLEIFWMNNKTIIDFGFLRLSCGMKNYADLDLINSFLRSYTFNNC